MNKLLATLLAGTFALTLGSSAFAADAAKPVEAKKSEVAKAAEPTKVEATAAVEPAKADASAKPAKKHSRKAHAKKAATAEAMPAAK